MKVTIIFTNGTTKHLILSTNENVKLVAEGLAWTINSKVELILINR